MSMSTRHRNRTRFDYENDEDVCSSPVSLCIFLVYLCISEQVKQNRLLNMSIWCILCFSLDMFDERHQIVRIHTLRLEELPSELIL